MEHFALYNLAEAYQATHKAVLDLAESLNDEQIRWKPAGYNLSVGFHLWHLARWADMLQAFIAAQAPELDPGLGNGKEIWDTERLGEKWQFPAELGDFRAGTGLGEAAADQLPIPPRDELIDYLRRAYQAMENIVNRLDERYPTFENLAETQQKKLRNIRQNVVGFYMHDDRHLGMMECLKGQQGLKGSATEG